MIHGPDQRIGDTSRVLLFTFLGRNSSLSCKGKARWSYNNRSLSWCWDCYWAIIVKRFGTCCGSTNGFEACNNQRCIFRRNCARLRRERSELRDEGNSDSNLLRCCICDSRWIGERNKRRNCGGSHLGGRSASLGARAIGACSRTITVVCVVCRRVIRLRVRHSGRGSDRIGQSVRIYDLGCRWLITIISGRLSVANFNCVIIGVSEDTPCHASCRDEALGTLFTRATKSLFEELVNSYRTKVGYILTVPELDTDGRAKHLCDMEHEPRVVSHKVPLHLEIVVPERHATCPSV